MLWVQFVVVSSFEPVCYLFRKGVIFPLALPCLLNPCEDGKLLGLFIRYQTDAIIVGPVVMESLMEAE